MGLLEGGPIGALQALLFSAAAAILGYGFGPKEDELTYVAAGLAAAMTICPIGLPHIPAMFVYLALAAGCVAAALRFDRRIALGLAAVELALATAVYMNLLYTGKLPIGANIAALLIAGGIAVFGGRIGRAISENIETCFLLFASAVIGQLGFLAVWRLDWLEPKFAVTTGILCIGIAALVLGFWRLLRDLRLVSFAGFALATVKVLTFDLSEAGPFVRIGLLFAVGIVLLVGGYWHIWQNRKPSALP